LGLAGAGLALDLTGIRNTKILGVENIDLTGTGNNAVTLNVQDLLDLSPTSNTLQVLGDARLAPSSTSSGGLCPALAVMVGIFESRTPTVSCPRVLKQSTDGTMCLVSRKSSVSAMRYVSSANMRASGPDTSNASLGALVMKPSVVTLRTSRSLGIRLRRSPSTALMKEVV